MKKIFIGSDHGGFDLKKSLTEYLEGEKIQVEDCGSYTSEQTDYPDFALAVGRRLLESNTSNDANLGILICRSGEGMDIAANKIPGIRAALVWREEVARETREDNNANVLVLPADYLSQQEAESIVKAFINTPFSGEERHMRRLDKIANIEKHYER